MLIYQRVSYKSSPLWPEVDGINHSPSSVLKPWDWPWALHPPRQLAAHLRPETWPWPPRPRCRLGGSLVRPWHHIFSISWWFFWHWLNSFLIPKTRLYLFFKIVLVPDPWFGARGRVFQLHAEHPLVEMSWNKCNFWLPTRGKYITKQDHFLYFTWCLAP
jgi:hypothetical protein